MTEINQDIMEAFYAGSSVDISVPVVDKDDQAFPLTNCEVTYVIFTRNTEEVVLVKSSLDSSDVEILSSPSNVFVIHILPSDTMFINGLFRHMASVVDANGYERPVFTGKIQIYKVHSHRPRQETRQGYTLGG